MNLLSWTKSLALIIALLVLAGCASTEQEHTGLDYEQSDADYLALKQTIINRVADSSTFDRILFTYPLTSFYAPTGDTEQAGKLLTESHMRSGEFTQCLLVAQQILAQNYTSLTGHYAAAQCANGVGDESSYRFHTWVLDNLIEGIWRTGSGQSLDDPLVINSTTDLFAFIQLHELVAVGQDLVYVEQLPIQRIRVQMPESNRTSNWYFNVTPQFRRAVLDSLEK